jgi:hypothetical protein
LFNLSLEAGQYYTALYINNSNVRISNKASFSVEAGVSVSNIKSGSVDFTVYPSPSAGRLTVLATRLPQNYLSLRISSITGKTVFEKKAIISPPDISEEIDLSSNDPGIYLIYLQAGNLMLVKKFILN